MEPQTLFKLLLGTNWILFLWDLYLNYRQYKIHLDNEKRPKKLEDIIGEEEYKKARDYKLDKHLFGFAHDIFGHLVSTVAVWYGVMPIVWDLTSDLPLQAVCFTIICNLAGSIIDIPWDLYDTFIIEEKHGFNKQTIGFYFVDQAKKFVVGAAITAPIVYVVEWIINSGGPYFFVYVWVFVSIVIFVLMTIYPAFIAPLFDKYIPLPDGELKTAIEKLAASVEYPLAKLYVVHGSKRSAHSNAYMYGFWKNKRIVLYDTLLSGEEREKVRKECAVEGETETEKEKARGMSNEEVVAVLGHELGHWALSHTMVNLIITELNLLLLFTVFSYFYKWNTLYRAFGFKTTPVIVGLTLVLQYVLALYNQITSFLMSIHSRRCEFGADKYAYDLGHGNKLKTALTKLCKDNLSLPLDDHLYSMFNHSHPPIVERVAALEEYKKKE